MRENPIKNHGNNNKKSIPPPLPSSHTLIIIIIHHPDTRHKTQSTTHFIDNPHVQYTIRNPKWRFETTFFFENFEREKMTMASEFLGCLMYNFISTGVLSSTAVLTFGELLAPRLVVLALGSGFGYLAGLFTSSVRFY